MTKKRMPKRNMPSRKGGKFVDFRRWQEEQRRGHFIELWRKQLNPVNEVQRRAVEAMLEVRLEFDNPNPTRLLLLCRANQVGNLRHLIKGATPEDAKIIKAWYAGEILPELTKRATEAFAESLTLPFLRFTGGMASLLEQKNK